MDILKIEHSFINLEFKLNIPESHYNDVNYMNSKNHVGKNHQLNTNLENIINQITNCYSFYTILYLINICIYKNI